MTVTVQNLRSFVSGTEPDSLLPGQLCYNMADRIVYVGDGSSDKTNFDGTTTPGVAGSGWFAMPMDFDSLKDYFVANPTFYGDIPTDGQVVSWSTALNHPVWTTGGGGGGGQVYTTTNGAVAVAGGATISEKISNAIGVASPDEGDAVIVTGTPGEVYQGLYLFTTEWVRAAYYAYPNASSVPYSNTISGLSAITVQQGIDELDVLVTAAQSTANTAVANAAAAQALANAALPRSGGTMTGTINFATGQLFPVSGIQDSSSSQKGVVQGGANMIYTSAGVIDVRAASTTNPGVVQLVNSTSNTSTSLAPTAAAVSDLQDQINGLTVASNVILAGTLDCAAGLVDSVTSDGTAAGFTVASPLPSAVGRADYYVIVSDAGSYNPPGGGGPYNAQAGDWFLSNGATWQYLGVGARPTYATTSVAGIVQLSDNAATQSGASAILAVTPSTLQSKVSDSVSTTSSTFIASSTAVKAAYDQGVLAQTSSIPKTTVATKGSIITASAANTPVGLPVGANGYILAANSATATGLEWVPDSAGDVTSVTGTAPITVNNFNPQTPIVGISAATGASLGAVQVGTNIDVSSGTISVKSATTGQAGVVQLEDTTSSTSSVLALTANQGYVLQQQINALAVSNNITLAGTIDGNTGFMLTVTTEGTAKGFVVGSPMPAPVAGNSEYFTIVTVPGTMTPPGGSAQLVNDGDWWLSNGTAWQYLSVGYSAPYATTAIPGVVQLATDAEVQAGVETTHAVVPSALQSKMSDSATTTSSTTIASSTAVKTAYDLADAAIPDATITAKGDLIAGTASAAYAALPVGTAGQFLSVNAACATGLEWCTISLACVPCSAYTAVGTILAGTGAGTYCSLPVGTNGQILVPNSACAAGVEWVTRTSLNICGYTCTATPFNTALGANAGDSIISGTNNTNVGWNAGTALTIGGGNTFVGSCAGDSAITADNSVAVGLSALTSAVTANGTVAIGSGALASMTSGAGNVGIGYQALDTLITGGCNTAVGFQTGTNVATNVSGNTLIGYQAGLNTSTGGQNTFVGNAAGSSVTTGANNTILGNYVGTAALTSNVVLSDGAGNRRFQANSSGAWSYDGTSFGTSGQFLASQGSGSTPVWCTLSLACIPCSAFTAAGQLLAGTGSSTFTAFTVGTNGQFLSANSACSAGLEWCTLSLACVPCSAFTAAGQLLAGTGTSTFAALTVGSNNQILVADSACTGGLKWFTSPGAFFCGYTCTASPFNTAIGANAGDSITSGTDNVTLGYNAGTAITTGSQNVVIGSGAAVSSNSVGVVTIGFCSGQALTTAGCVTHIGFISGRNSTGPSNTYVGALTGCAASNTSACGTLLGFCAGSALTTGNGNIFVGFQSGRNVNSGANNVAIGTAAFQTATTATNNVAVGCGALSGLSTSSGNTALGHRAMLNASTAANNVAIGCNAGEQLSTGSNNVLIGDSAGDTITTGTQNTFVGSGSGGLVATTSEGNTGLGFSALGQGVTSGAYNVAIGNSAGLSVTSGALNTLVGYTAGQAITTGGSNTLVGRYVGTSTLSNNVVLSDGAGAIRFQSNSSGAISLGAGGAYGTAGQILVSNGSGAAPTWTSSGTASANYGSFVRTTTQTNAGGASGNAVSYDTTSSANNFSIVSGSRITAAVAGTYQILASLQVQKTDAGTDDVNFWVKKNGVNEPNSAYNLTLQGSNAAQLGYINWVVTLAAGDYVELWWYSADANARLLADPAVAPYPAVPASGFIIHPMGA